MRPPTSGLDTEIPCIIAYPSFSSSSSRSSPQPQHTYNSYQQQQQQQQYASPSSFLHPSSSNMSSDSCQAMDFDCAVSTLSHNTPPPQHHEASSFGRKHSRQQQQRRHDSPPPPSTVVTTHHRRLVSPTSSPMSSHCNSHSPKTPHSSETIRANVGGECFSFPMSAFKDFSGLPWKFDSSTNVYHLNCSPAVFEVLLDYTLFGTLPAYDTMCQEEFEEFELMALSLRTSIHITPLIAHLDRKSSYWNRELKRQYNRQLDASSQKSRPILLNPDTNATTTSSANATKCARFLGALCGVADTFRPSRRRPASVALYEADATNAAKRLKLTQQGRWTSS